MPKLIERHFVCSYEPERRGCKLVKAYTLTAEELADWLRGKDMRHVTVLMLIPPAPFMVPYDGGAEYLANKLIELHVEASKPYEDTRP